MSGYSTRPATPEDIEFLVETIVAAEKSNSEHFGLATLFGLDEPTTRKLIRTMLEEEIDGCELSISSFRVATTDGKAVAAVGGWIEGAEEEMPSAMLKSNLISFTYPRPSLAVVQTHGPAITPLVLEREIGTLQIEYVFVHPDHRGHQLAGTLIEDHIAAALKAPNKVRKAAVQAYSNNTAAIRAYGMLGFGITRTVATTPESVANLLPYHEKVLMEMNLE